MSLVGESGPSYPACGWRPTRVIGGKIQARLSGLWAENIMALGDHGCYLSVTGCYIYILWVDGRGQPVSHCRPGLAASPPSQCRQMVAPLLRRPPADGAGLTVLPPVQPGAGGRGAGKPLDGGQLAG